MVHYYQIDNNFYYVNYIYYCLNKIVIHYCYQVINNNSNHIIAVAFPVIQKWQICYKIHEQVFLRIGKYWQRYVISI